MKRKLAVGIWVVFIVVAGMTYYVNHYLPHGRLYATGDVACLSDDRDCRPAYAEDMRNLNIPDWAKFLREYGIMLLLGLGVAGVFASTKFEDTRAQKVRSL